MWRRRRERAWEWAPGRRWAVWAPHSPCWSLGMNLQSWCPRSGLMIAVAQGRRRRGGARGSVAPAGRELLARLVRGFVGWESRSLRSGNKQVSVSPTGCWLLTEIVRACPRWDIGPYLVEARYNSAEQERPFRAVKAGTCQSGSLGDRGCEKLSRQRRCRPGKTTH